MGITRPFEKIPGTVLGFQGKNTTRALRARETDLPSGSALRRSTGSRQYGWDRKKNLSSIDRLSGEVLLEGSQTIHW